MVEALTHAPAVDPLHDPARIAAARRLLREVSGHAAFDRLSRLAARLAGADHAKVTLFTDGDLVIGGHGLTAFLQAAEAAGCKTANGGHMVEAAQDVMADFMLRKADSSTG